MKVVVKVGKSVREVDLQHLVDTARAAVDDTGDGREAIQEEVTALFVGALCDEWLRISEEVKSSGLLKDWVMKS